MMPSDGPGIILNISKLASVVTGPVDLGTTYTNSFVTDANKTLGYSG